MTDLLKPQTPKVAISSFFSAQWSRNLLSIQDIKYQTRKNYFIQFTKLDIFKIIFTKKFVLLKISKFIFTPFTSQFFIKPQKWLIMRIQAIEMTFFRDRMIQKINTLSRYIFFLLLHKKKFSKILKISPKNVPGLVGSSLLIPDSTLLIKNIKS